MLPVVQNFIPIIASEASLCLTEKNWREAQVSAISYSVEFLLHKPGKALLDKIDDFASYIGWSGTLILNAASLAANKEGIYELKSPYDGSKVRLTSLELILLLQHLKPQIAILPQNILQDCPQIWTLWNSAIIPFIHAEELVHHQIKQKHGVYFNFTKHVAIEQLAHWLDIPCYVMGTFNNHVIDDLRAKKIDFIETEEPVKAAFQGRVYSSTGEVDLTKNDVRMQFEGIDSQCVCPSCEQKFTKAYLHHLLQHTPLLCQRLLIQHNVFWMAHHGSEINRKAL